MRYARPLFAVVMLVALTLSWNLAAQEETPDSIAPEIATPFLLPDAESTVGEIALGPCSATLDCGDQVISCIGNSTCQANNLGGYVECDGQRTTCPNRCTVGITCNCECGPQGFSCSSNSGNCQTGSEFVACNGFTLTCTRICRLSCPFLP